MTAPNRRWFAFSLRTMFVGVTLAAALIAWNSQRRSFEVIGHSSSLSADDISEIRGLVRNVRRLDRNPIVTVYVVGPRQVHVFTKRNGQQHGEETSMLRNSDGLWRNMGGGSWTE